MQRSRVLVVDDSVVFRVMLSRMLREEGDLEVAGVAGNGRAALELIRSGRPDVVILDVEMPELNGLDTLVEIRKEWPDLPVIICSSQTQAGAATVIDALFRGANECIAKPDASAGGREARMERLRSQVITSIRSLLHHDHRLPPRPEPERPPAPRRRALGAQPRVIVIGSSTGGPGALRDVLGALPGDLQMPVLVVQHMPAVFTRRMAERLNERSALTVQEAFDGATPSAGQVWIAPGGQHMVVRVGEDDGPVLRLNNDPPVQSCRPSVDTLFFSAVEAFGAGVIGVVLTGMGKDGADGCRAIREAGGQVIVQDAESSVVWGMPRAVVQAGLHDVVLPLDQIAGEIGRRAGRLSGLREVPPHAAQPLAASRGLQ